MGVIIAAILLSVVVIVPALTGLFLSGLGGGLRGIGAVLVLPLLGVVVWIGYTSYYRISIGPGDGWTELAIS